MATPKKFLTGVDLGGQKGTNAADGSVATDLATYGQLLSLMNGKDFKDGARAGSSANVNVSAPGTTVGGVTMSVNDRVLLLGQTSAAENGLWVFNGSGSAMTRPADFVTGEVTQGATAVVDEGTLAATQWTLTTSGAITVGTTGLSFTQTTGGASYSPGNGIQISSGSISIKLPAGSGLIADGTGLYVDPAVVPRKYAQAIGDGSATSITVTHNLGTRDVAVALYDTSTFEELDTYFTRATANTVVLSFATAPGAGAIRVVVIG